MGQTLISLNDIDFALPECFIAQEPAKMRDESKLIVYNRSDDTITHLKFHEITKYFNKNILLVRNTSKVMHAKLIGKKRAGTAKIEIILINEKTFTKDSITFSVLTRRAKLGLGQFVDFNDNVTAEIIGSNADTMDFKFNLSRAEFYNYLDKFGRAPLPPYIKRRKENPEIDKNDKERYQTIYADKEGSIAAPTAGLHFTRNVLNEIQKRGTDIESLTLHVGLGTFKPIVNNDITNHKMLPERYSISDKLAGKLTACHKNNKKICTVGTTTTRAVEAFFKTGNKDCEADLFIYPGFSFNIDMLITNLHVPRSTPLLLVSAFIAEGYKKLGDKKYIDHSITRLKEIYKEAIKENYRFYSYGDAMLII
ncbi:MAG: tRNA preQ1(34) S-adenosylmethionine ribosyltransferase-isomerase QueA [Elusimicrobiota bacterium]